MNGGFSESNEMNSEKNEKELEIVGKYALATVK